MVAGSTDKDLSYNHRWTPSGPNEVGIDGYIELFDSNSHQSLGLTVAVQSKVVTAIADDSNPAFDYWCDANDVEYWLNGNTPVILVVSSPALNESYWISVKDCFKDWTPAKPARVTFVSRGFSFIGCDCRCETGALSRSNPPPGDSPHEPPPLGGLSGSHF